MGIKVSWQDKQNTLVYFQLKGNWDWPDFDTAFETMVGMTADTRQPLTLIWDFTQTDALPNGALIYWGELMHLMPAYVSSIIFVCPAPLIRTAANMFQRMDDKMKVQIIVTSTLDQGLTILESQDPARNRILVIDDGIDLLQEIVETLRFEGYKVAAARDGAEGVKKAMATVPDLIICDIMMPKMDGFDVLMALRQNDKTAAIPFIFLTAMADRAYMRTGMEMGADDYMTKPFEQQELLNAVKARLIRQAIIRYSK